MKKQSSNNEDVATLQLIVSEFSREIADINQRQANAITRSSIVLAAAGLTLFLPITSHPVIYQIPTFLFSVLSIVTGLKTIWYWKSEVMDFSKIKVAIYMQLRPNELLEQIVNGLTVEYESVVRDLDRKSSWATCSIVFLASSWFFYILLLPFSLFK